MEAKEGMKAVYATLRVVISICVLAVGFAFSFIVFAGPHASGTFTELAFGSGIAIFTLLLLLLVWLPRGDRPEPPDEGEPSES
jgi:hypothetical protein